jgi:DNA-3-methyladenine glycosylase II
MSSSRPLPSSAASSDISGASSVASVSSTTLTPRPPYNHAWTLAWLRTSSSAVLEEVDDDGVYRRALDLAGYEVLLVLRSTGTADAPRLILDVYAEGQANGANAETVARAAAHLRRVLLLDADPAPFFAIARHDPLLDTLLSRFDGMRPQLLATPYEALLWAIIGQQVNITFAKALKRRLVALVGRSLTVDGVTYPLLPRPTDLAALDPAVLRANQFSRQKIAYLIDVSQAVAAGALDFEALHGLPHEEAIAAMTRHKGIGRWTAEYVLMRGLGDPDSIPAADMGLRAILGKVHALGRHASEAEVRAYAAAWAPWRGWAAATLWLALQTRMPLPSL